MTPPEPVTDADGHVPGPGQIICRCCGLVQEPFDVTERGRPLCRDCAERLDMYDCY
jgi:formylmethanofuran dehydrogenase subunit E